MITQSIIGWFPFSKNWSQSLEQKINNKMNHSMMNHRSLKSSHSQLKSLAAFIHSARGVKAPGLAQLIEQVALASLEPFPAASD